MRRQLPELVAPAGSPGALQAAIEHGADAVYLGLRHLSARAHATNFALEQLGPAVQLAHAAGVKVLVTLNTLLRADELTLASRLLRACHDAEVDAVVVQDLGTIALARRLCPGLRLHGSTQLAVHDADGVATAARLGLTRVVLARELSLAEISVIHRRVPDAELEVFAHGSLCFSASGLCLASALTRGRRRGRSAKGRSHEGDVRFSGWATQSGESFSGNRGRCTQPCRRPFHDPDGRDLGLPFSLRDLMSLDLVGPLADAGVAALKIEGRLRSPTYVAAACHAYRGALELAAGREPPPGWDREEAERALRSLFSRRASTGYLVGAGSEASRLASAAPVSVQPIVQGHMGPRVGAIAARGDGWLLAAVERTFRRGDRLLVAGVDGGLGHQDLPWLEDEGGAPIETAEPGQRARIPAPTRREVPVGAELRLAHAPEVGRRFAVEAPRLLPSGHLGPAVQLVLRTTESELAVTATADGVRVERSYRLGPEPVDALRAPALEAVFERVGDAFTLGPVRCEVIETSPLRTPRKALRRVRRDILRRLELALELRGLEGRYPPLSDPPPLLGGASPERWCLRSDRPALLPLGASLGYHALELCLDPAQPERLAQTLEMVGPASLACVLPPVLRGADRAGIATQIRSAREAGVKRWIIAGLGQDALVDASPGETVEGDDLLYTANPRAAALAARSLGLAGLTLPLELDRPGIEAMLANQASPCTVVLYADVAVFRSALPPRPRRAVDPGLPLLDELEQRFLRAREGRTSVLVDGSPTCLSAQLDELRGAGARSFRVDLRWRSYREEDARRLLAAVRGGQPVPGTSPGNWARRWL